jgi:alkanesulfonate monooxygenase SsuD/methylene tetrahydromethanopterin reductase-like flavin-dependent oxidoreductase (luciferase family)
MAKQAEAQGLHGCFAPQVYGPPFLPLATAAAVTQRIQLASGIAIAAARSPFETAMAALDMDRISGGRFVLGLGASVLAWSRGVYGAPEHKPLAHLTPTSGSSSPRSPRCARRSPSGSRRCARPWSGWPHASATA